MAPPAHALLLSLCLSVASLPPASPSHRVLVAFPHPGRSHGILGHSVVDTLLDAGHEVTYVTAYPRTTGNPRLKYVDVSSLVGDAAGADGEDLGLQQHRILQTGAELALLGLRHPAMQALLMDTAQGFDAVVAEWFYSGLLAPLAAVYECPLVWYSASDASWLSVRLVHEAGPPAYSAAPLPRALPPAPFALVSRAHQLWTQLYLSGWTYYMTHYVERPIYEELYGHALSVRGRTLPEYETLVLNASLLLVNSHPPLAQPLPLPQSVQYVGGHHLQLPTEPLTKELQEILDNAENGAILFSMGSDLKSNYFTERMRRELVEQLGRLEQTVLWKCEEKLENLPGNLHVLDWAPQTSILNHPNTILLISHGRLLSVMEATQFGVPIVGIPLFGDQFINMDLAVARGCGIRVDFTPDLPVKIKEAVNEMLGNFSYRRNSLRASAQFSARAAPAREALAHWVRLAIESRGAPHLRSPALLLSTIERLYLDILLLVLLGLWFLSKVLKVIRVHWTPNTVNSFKKDN